MSDEAIKTKEQTTKETEPDPTDDGSNATLESKDSEEVMRERARADDATAKLIKMQDAEKKRRTKDLEDQGKYKEALEAERAETAAARVETTRATRRVDLRAAVDEIDTRHNRAQLVKNAERIDAVGGYEGDITEVLKQTLSEADALTPEVDKSDTVNFPNDAGSKRKPTTGVDAEESKLIKLHADWQGDRTNEAKKIRYMRQRRMVDNPVEVLRKAGSF